MKRLFILSLLCLIFFSGCEKQADTIAQSDNSSGTEISAETVLQKLNDPNVKIIDVREENEYMEQHLSDAVLMPLNHLQDIKNSDIKQNSEIIVYCRTGRRSLQALKTLRELGYNNVYSMKGGILAWVSAGNKVCKNTEKTC